MASPQSKYIYTPLDPTTQEIRLSALHPNASLTAPVILTLSTASLATKPKYEAISYVWGDPTITAPISLDGVSVEVTTNLETALRYFRLETEVRILWADAICINQRDDSEKNVQVSIMGDIYRSCSKCLAWLGGDLDGDGAVTFAMIEDIALSKTIPLVECVNTIEHPISWLKSLSSMMQRPYWSRIWVVQETILPLIAEYWCGRSTIDRKVWTTACQHVGYQHLVQIAKLCEPCNLGLFAFLSEAGNRIVWNLNATATTAYSPSDGFWALHNTQRLLCQNQLDKVYAVRALTTPVFQSAIAVDYGNTTLNRLSVQVLQADAIDGGSLPYSCPSWWPVPQWKPELVDIYETSSNSTIFKVLQDPNFHTSGSSKVVLDLESIEEGILGVLSTLVDNIDASSGDHVAIKKSVQVCEKAILPASKYPGGGTTSNALWRTLISDHVLKEDNKWNRADQAHEQTFWSLWSKISTRRLSEFLVSATSSKMSGPEFYAFLVFHYATNLRSFLTTRKGYIGNRPNATRSGDEVHLVAGSNWPLMLRKISDATASSPATYRRLGKCYIHGIMDGEAAENFEERATEIHLA
ncbi:heterokaryon incompatibility protein-domain-containing protein [Leptodontidium sp. MPI-SDFR-AT-0119]|nr:heterokaryon incompatibility protein-domain-containing protein [Leptodontidium sp. MPI-SDFR-AT-0119]